jgi:micrococcal nuclease
MTRTTPRWSTGRLQLIAMGLVLVFLPGLVAACGDSAREPAPVGPTPATRTERATVVRIVDGDTIVVDRGHGPERVRYIGIDTPELGRPGTPAEPLGEAAAAANEALVGDREVLLERDVSETDRFGRLLRYVWVETEAGLVLVNLELVSQGFAHAVSYPPDVARQDRLREAERAARDAGRGLWSDVVP